ESSFILPSTSRTEVSAACTTASSGFLLSKRYARASFSRYCTANLMTTMFSSIVSIAESFRPVAFTTLSRPMSTERICQTVTAPALAAEEAAELAVEVAPELVEIGRALVRAAVVVATAAVLAVAVLAPAPPRVVQVEHAPGPASELRQRQAGKMEVHSVRSRF